MMARTQKRKSPRILIILLIAVLFLFLINYYSGGVRNLFYCITGPIQKFFWRAGENASGFWGTVLNAGKIKNELVDLTIKNQELLNKLSQLDGLQKENDVLRQAMNLNLQKEYGLMLAGIISKDIAQDSILIDMGSEDGVAENMPAIDQRKVLFGKVSDVYKNFSRVTLITEKDFVSDVNVQTKEVQGVARGSGGMGLLLDLIPKDAPIAQGDILISSTVGGIFPKDLLVGEISAMNISDTKPYQTAEVKPFFNLNTAEAIFLITNFKK